MPNTKSVYFGISPEPGYDRGIRPCCAVNPDGLAIEIHEGESRLNDTLNWRIGSVNGVNLTWEDKSDQLGSGSKFDNGFDPAVALTTDNIAIEIHGSERLDGGFLFYSVGKVMRRGNRHTVTFPSSGTQIGTDHAHDPSIAVNEGGAVLEVHTSGGNLFYRLGSLQNRNTAQPTVQWPARPIPLPRPNNAGAIPGGSPAVAMNNSGQIVVCYQTPRGSLTAILGQLNAARTSITWGVPQQPGYDSGEAPSVALTADGFVFETHEGRVPGNVSLAGLAAGYVVDRVIPGLAAILGLVEPFLTPGSLGALFQRVGRIQPASGNRPAQLVWLDWLQVGTQSYFFDSGQRPQVATNGKVAIQVHESETQRALFANASLVFDRANWMGDNVGALKQRTLRQIALPASHDSGAYMSGPLDTPAQTQDIDFYGQLSYGVRYFDIRPTYRGSGRTVNTDELYTHHDVIKGPPLKQVIAQVRRFMSEHKELVILKISHYDKFNQDVFDAMAMLFTDEKNGLGPWLFKDAAQNFRLATRPIVDYIPTRTENKVETAVRGTMLIVADKEEDGSRDYVRNPYPNPSGIWRYRDWQSSDPHNGDLTVFDIYSHTNKFDELSTGEKNDPDKNATQRNGTRLPQGQLPKYRLFNGICRNTYKPSAQAAAQNEPCDLFLLSWTLTPTVAQTTTYAPAVILSRAANKQLIDTVNLASAPARNTGNRIITTNLIYTDAVEKSRSADFALVRNSLAE